MKYSEIKDQVYKKYSKFNKINNDNIQEVNDKIIDYYLSKNIFEDVNNEFYITLSMCLFMIEHDFYDSYFFDSFNELFEEYNNKEDSSIKDDIDTVIDYLKKDKTKNEYYDKLTEVYNNMNKEKMD